MNGWQARIRYPVTSPPNHLATNEIATKIYIVYILINTYRKEKSRKKILSLSIYNERREDSSDNINQLS